MTELKETAANYIVGDNYLTFYSAERRWINKIENLAKKYPDKVEIRCINPDGSILAHLPAKWLKISPPRQVSEEQRIAAGERMRQYHQSNQDI